VRLAQFSDLHLLSLDGVKLLDYANKRWIGRMNLISNRSRHYHTIAFDDMVADLNAQAPDHIICTGDVTNLALEQEFHFARERFDRLALGTTGVTVIPGNHDAYVAEGTRHFAAVFGDYATADDDWRWPREPGDDTDVDARWPIVRVRGELALIAISTSLQTPWFTAYGRIGVRQLARVKQALGDPRLADKCRVVAIHHPPAGRRAESRIRGLRDRDDLAAILAEHGAALVIHGHEHRNLRETLPGPSAPIEVLGVPSGTYDAKHPERTARYRIFEIEGTRIVDHHMRVWHRASRTFVRDETDLSIATASA
jgi:3',5'-cyclic AMP phosphodiesterase CpdA